MKYYLKLPRNKKEAILFMLIISLISVNLIAPLITFLERGFSLEIWMETLKIIPFIWIVVIALVAITNKPTELLVKKIITTNSEFEAHMIINTLITVFMMSMVLTVLGTWIGTRTISLEPFHRFIDIWPRNFMISFLVESIIAQPIARKIMEVYHIRIESKM